MTAFGLSTLRRWFRDDSLRRVYLNAGTLFRGRILAGIISLLYLSVAAQALGAVQLGVLILLNLLVVTAGDLSIFPGWHSLIRYGSGEFSTESTDGCRKLLYFVSFLELGSGLAGVLIAVTATLFLAPALGITGLSRSLLLIFSLAALSSARSTPAAVLYLCGRFNTLALQQALAGTVRLIGALLASLTNAGIEGFIYAWLAANLAEAGFMWLFAVIELRRRGFFHAGISSPLGVSRMYPGLWRFCVMTKFNKSLEDISPRVTPLTVGIVLDPAAVGLFHVAFRLGMLLSQPVIVLVGTVYPELTRLVKAQEMAGAHQLVVRSGLIAAAAGTPFLAIYLLFGHSILDTVGGTGFAAAYSVLVLIAASQVIQLLGFPLGSALQAIGQADVVLRTNLIAMAVLVPALIVLLQIYGLIGAGLYALILAALVVGFLGIIWWKRTR